MAILEKAGVQLSNNHGFTAHITLAYAPAGTEMPDLMLPTLDLTFDAISLAWGDEVEVFPLTGSPEAKKAEVIREELRRWQTVALKALKRGDNPDVVFKTDVIDPAVCSRLHTGLKAAQTSEAVKTVFAIENRPPEAVKPEGIPMLEAIPDLVKALNDAANSLKWRGYP